VQLAIVDDASTAQGVADAVATLLQQGVRTFVGPFGGDLTAVAVATVEAFTAATGGTALLLSSSSGEG
jgi:type IV secretory pathway VirB2 component (pilin)